MTYIILISLFLTGCNYYEEVKVCKQKCKPFKYDYNSFRESCYCNLNMKVQELN